MHAFGAYGAGRDALVARSKIVLSMHYYEPAAFEIVRVAYLLANAKAVVAEVNPGETVDADLLPGLEKAGLVAMQARREDEILAAVLGAAGKKPAMHTNIEETAPYRDKTGLT
jgi:hypothetical protein